MEDQVHPLLKLLHGIVLFGLIGMGLAKWASKSAKAKANNPPDTKLKEETPETKPTPELRLIRPTAEQLARIGQYWPGGFGELPDEPGKYFLSFRHSNTELTGLKVQFVDITADLLERRARIYRAILAASIKTYLQHNHQGVLFPMVYFKVKENSARYVEVGFALFVGPAASNRPDSEAQESELYDDALGRGATPMVMDMIGALTESAEKLSLPFPPIIGLDLRTRSQLGDVVMDFLIESEDAFVIRPEVNPAVVPWRFLLESGISDIPHLPVSP